LKSACGPGGLDALTGGAFKICFSKLRVASRWTMHYFSPYNRQVFVETAYLHLYLKKLHSLL
jgi:hypothetical protein